MFSNIKPKTLLIILLVIIIPITLYLYLNKDKGIDNIKEHIKTLIPEKYEVIEEDKEGNDGCTILYTIYPKEYSELEKKYLVPSTIRYCKDMNTVSFDGQVGSVEYNKEKNIWFYTEGDNKEEQEKIMFGEREVIISSISKSHGVTKLYITRIGKSNEIIVFYIPETNRIRCDSYDDEGNEIHNPECVDFLTSLGMSPDSTDFVPEQIYEESYKELVEILKEI